MRWVLVVSCWIWGLGCWGSPSQDSISVDSIQKPHEISKIRQTIRGFDETEDYWIEPQHYEFQVMGQITRSYESFTLSSGENTITLSPDSKTKVGPYFGWR